MLLEPSCIGLSNVAKNGTKNSGLFACSIICKISFETNERDKIIHNRPIHKANEQVVGLKIEDNLELPEAKLASLLNRNLSMSWKCPVK